MTPSMRRTSRTGSRACAWARRPRASCTSRSRSCGRGRHRLRAMVYLVGAGPGDPGLMTRRSLELIARADAILYDRLIPPGALEGARADADLRYVGKQPGGHAMEQHEINAQLVDLGGRGLDVVRLKGGDPFVFG